MPLLRTSELRSAGSALLNIFGILTCIDVLNLRQNQTGIHKETISEIDLPQFLTLDLRYGIACL